MLMIIDMQNDYLDEAHGKKYVKDAEKIVDGIIERIKDAEDNGEYIYYTSDIPIEEYEFKREHKQEPINDNETIELQVESSNMEEKWGCEPYKLLRYYLDKHEEVKKSYYAIPPETLLKFQQKFKEESHIIKEIEFVGVETHICVLANAICLQSAFPQAKMVINGSLCRSKNEKDHQQGLKIMESLGMEIRR